MSRPETESGKTLSAIGGSRSAESYCAACDKSYPSDHATCPIDGSSLVLLPEEKDTMLGRVFDGRFEVVERVGTGGMGTVYRGFQASVGRNVAIKVIDPVVSRNRATVKRFMREARLASRLAHPNTVVVHDFGQTHDGVVYLVMELIEGKTLRELMRASGPLSKELMIRLGTQMCDALHAAHSIGIVHRDLKPSNVMILDGEPGRERLKVLDFGLAKSLSRDTSQITDSRVVLGTPLYMSPEMIRAEEVDGRSDLYALGCTLYEMAEGRAPFVSPRAEILFAQHLEDLPEPLERRDLGSISKTIMQLLAKQPGDRPDTAADVRAVLERESSGAPTEPVPVSMTPQPSEPSAAFAARPTMDLGGSKARAPSRRPLILALLVVFVMASAGAAIYMTRGGGTNDSQRPVAAQPAAVVDAAASPPSAPTVAPPASARKVTLSFDSSPASQVRVGDKSLGSTPASIEVDPGSAKLEVVFSREGYASSRRELVPDTDRKLVVELKRSSRNSRKGQRARARRSKREKKAPPPATIVAKPVSKPPKKTPPKPPPKPKKKADPEPIFRLNKK